MGHKEEKGQEDESGGVECHNNRDAPNKTHVEGRENEVGARGDSEPQQLAWRERRSLPERAHREYANERKRERRQEKRPVEEKVRPYRRQWEHVREVERSVRSLSRPA